MPFREDILELYPKAIRELNRRGVDVSYIATNSTFLLKNKQGRSKILQEADLEKLETDLNLTGNLEVVQIELINQLL